MIDPQERWRPLPDKPDYAGFLSFGGAPGDDVADVRLVAELLEAEADQLAAVERLGCPARVGDEPEGLGHSAMFTTALAIPALAAASGAVKIVGVLQLVAVGQ